MKREQKKPWFLIFSDNWGEHPSSCQHIFGHILKEYEGIWVNTIGMRMPRFNGQDAGKIFHKLINIIFGNRGSREGKCALLGLKLQVLDPFMVPIISAPFRWLNSWSVVRTIKRAMKKSGYSSPIVVTTVPNVGDYLGRFGESKVVYYCVDDFSEWPGYKKEAILNWENDLIEKSDTFIATSKKLFNKLAQYGKATFLLPHGVHLAPFQSLAPEARHSAFKSLKKPIFGYVGLIDKRLDFDLLCQIVPRLPDASFVFVGRSEITLRNALPFPNVYHVPAVPHEMVPTVLNSLDACILPYLLNDLTESINPLKLKEYLASGKSVISTNLPEVSEWKPHVSVQETKEGWCEALANISRGKSQGQCQEIEALLQREDWHYKSQEFLRIVTTC